MAEMINIGGYIPVVPNEIYRKDIVLISPTNFIYENGIMKPLMIGHNMNVIAFARFKDLNKSILEKLVLEAEKAASLHTQWFGKQSPLYIEPDSAIQRCLLNLPYARIKKILNKAYIALEYIGSREETSKELMQSEPDTFILRFGVLPYGNLETEDTSNPFFSISDQMRDEAIPDKKSRQKYISFFLGLKRGLLPDKDKLFAMFDNLPNIYSIELKNIFEELYRPSALNLVPIREITPDILDEAVIQQLNKL